MELENYFKQFPPATTKFNRFLPKDSNLQCTYIPPFVIIHQSSLNEELQISDLLKLKHQNIQQSHNLYNRTFYTTLNDERKAILKDGEDWALIILPSQNIIPIGVFKSFSKQKKQYLHAMYYFDKLKNESYKSLFQ